MKLKEVLLLLIFFLNILAQECIKAIKMSNILNVNLFPHIFSVVGRSIDLPYKVSFDQRGCETGDVIAWQPFEDSKEFPLGVIRCHDRLKKIGAVCVYVD